MAVMAETSDILSAVEGQLPRALIAPRGGTLRNAVFRFGAQFAAIGVNLIATPFIVRSLGVELFGVAGIVNAMIGFMTIITVSFTSTVGRNLTFAIEKQDYEKASKEISTAVFGLSRLLIVVLLPACAISLFIEHLIIVPPHAIMSARLFFILALFSFAVSTISGPLGAAMFVRNRLDLLSGLNLARTALFVGTLIVLFGIVGASLITYGIALLISSTLILLISLKAHRYLLRGIAITRHWFDRAILRDIMSLGGWMTVSQVGVLLFIQTDLIIANRAIGPTAAGQLAAVSIISLQLRAFAGLVSSLFAPNQIALWVRADKKEFYKYLFRSIRLLTLFMALFVGILCGSAKEGLSIWLGPEFGKLAPVVIIANACLVLTIGVLPSWNALLAAGKVKVPGIVTVIMGAANIILGFMLARKMGLIGIVMSGGFMLTLRNVVFLPWYCSRVFQIRLLEFGREIGIGSICGLVIALSTYGVIRTLSPHSVFSLLTALGISATLGLIVVVPFGYREMKRMSVEPV